MNFTFGFLYKKRYVEYQGKQQELFEFKDFAAGIHYMAAGSNEIFHVLTGDHQGVYASVLNEKANEYDDVAILKSISKAVEENENRVEFIKIRKKAIESQGKYYIRKGASLERLVNQEFVRFLENQGKKSGFAEEAFEKTTDISAMYSSVKKTIVSQDEPVMRILTSLFKNQKVINSKLDVDLVAKLKENILIYGPTGTGKTEILKRISKLYDIPIVIVDVTTLSETGYQGRKITDILEDLCLAANGNIGLAEKGILVLDEFDKLAEKPGDTQSHVSRHGVQRSLLKLLDGSTFYFNNKQFNTSKLTIVCLGAFSEITNGENYKNLKTGDFVKYGIMQELMGRFSKTIAMNTLLKEDIVKIVTDSDFSPLNTYKKLFESMHITFEYDNEFVEWLAERAVALNSGARSIKTVFDDCISSAMFRIFAGEYSAIKLVKPKSQGDVSYILIKKEQ